MGQTVLFPASHWRLLRVYAEENGSVAALILITCTRHGTDVLELELPYLLLDSLGTREAANMVLRHYRHRRPEVVQQLGACRVHRRIAASLQRLCLDYRQRLAALPS